MNMSVLINDNVGALAKTAPVVALHCSGSTGIQWSKLAARLGPEFAVTAPDLLGHDRSWSGDDVFGLVHEAAPVIAEIDAIGRPVHLVGHSYGGGLALHIAARRMNRIASLTLYEPTAFHTLKTLGPRGKAALSEIVNVAHDVSRAVVTGAYREGARRFVDYWNGAGMFDRLKPEAQAGLIRWLPKGPLDFQALINESTSMRVYRRFSFPVLILHGEHAQLPTRLIAERLGSVIPTASVVTVDGAGHMGPFSHAEVVNGLVGAHIVKAEQRRDGEYTRRDRPAVYSTREAA